VAAARLIGRYTSRCDSTESTSDSFFAYPNPASPVAVRGSSLWRCGTNSKAAPRLKAGLLGEETTVRKLNPTQMLVLSITLILLIACGPYGRMKTQRDTPETSATALPEGVTPGIPPTALPEITPGVGCSSDQECTFAFRIDHCRVCGDIYTMEQVEKSPA
jgi:hypothetical protein